MIFKRSPLAGGALKISWRHDCDAETTKFTVVGESGGWIAIGLKNGDLDELQKMRGVEFYMFTATEFRNGFVELAGDNSEPVAIGDTFVDASSVMLSEQDGIITAIFERPWETTEGDVKHALLTSTQKINVLVARNDDRTEFTRQHGSNQRLSLPKTLDMFPAPGNNNGGGGVSRI